LLIFLTGLHLIISNPLNNNNNNNNNNNKHIEIRESNSRDLRHSKDESTNAINDDGSSVSVTQLREDFYKTYLPRFVGQMVAECQKENVSKNVKQLILSSFDILITSLQKEFAPYVKSVASLLVELLIKDPYTYGIKIVGCTLHKLFQIMNSTPEFKEIFQEICRTLFALLIYDLESVTNNFARSDESEDVDDDSISEEDLVPQIQFQILQLFKKIFKNNELCQLYCANTSLVNEQSIQLYEWLVTSLKKDLFFDTDIFLRIIMAKVLHRLLGAIPQLRSSKHISESESALSALLMQCQSSEAEKTIKHTIDAIKQLTAT